MVTDKPYTVLLIDDSAEDRLTYCRYLQRGSPNRYQILEADSAASGLDLFQRLHPDAILLDYSLPDRDGLEVLALLQQDEKRRVPILILTGQGNETIAVQAIKQGAQDYLIKSKLTADSLCKVLQQAIEQFQLQQRLAQQEQQQRILSAIALRIHRALSLQTILDVSVAEVRQVLEADRVIVYQFAPDMSGQIVAEAVLPEWSKSLQVQIEDTCFRENLGGDYRLGRTRAIDNIYAANLTDCHLELLERFQVKANLVVPLLLVDQEASNAEAYPAVALPQLWGLLVVHQCSTTRQWLPFEIELLNQVAVRMAIAIQQAELYRQLQTELAERQRTEAALRESNQRYDALTAMSPVGLFETDAEGHCLYVNERWCQIAGLTPVEAAGSGWINGIYQDDRPRVSTEWYQATQANNPFNLEYRFQNAAGRVTWVYGQAVAKRDASGETVGYIGTITDINDHKQAELLLQAANQQITSIWESMTDAYATLDRNWQIVYLNQAAQQAISFLTNLEPEAILGKSHWELFPSFVGQPLEQEYQRAIAEQVAVHLDVFYEPTGHWFEVHAYPSTVGLGVYFRDISDRKYSEAERQKAMQALQASTAALAWSEQRYRSLVTATTQAVWAADPEGRTSEDIPGWRALTGQTQAEASGWGWMEAIHPEDRAKTAEAWRIAVTTKKLYEVEHRVRVANGEYRYFIGRAAPVLDERRNIREWIGAHTDITEAKRDEAVRQQIENALRSSEEQLRLALDFNQIGSWDWNILTNQLTWNENHARLLGLDPQHVEASYQNWRDRVHPEDVDRVEASIQQALLNHTRFVEDYRVLYPDGTLHWLTGKGQAIYNEAGQPLRMLGVILDITDRKQAEATLQQLNQELEARVQERTAKLQASEAKLRETQRIAKIGNWEFDLATQTITWSEDLFRLFELDPTQGEPAYAEHLQCFFPESRSQLEEAVQQATTLGIPYELELQFQRADGSIGWFLGRGEAVRDAQGTIVKLLGTALDISKRKQAEQAVRESEHRFATLAAAAPDAIFRFDTTFNCVYVNQRWSEMTGRPTEAGMGWGWADTIHPEDRYDTSERVAQWFQTHQAGDVCRHEARILRPDGSIVWYFCQMLPETDANGAMTGYVGTLTDISDRKQAEAKLHQVSNRLMLAVKSGAIGIWDWNVVDNILTWDERMYELYGITSDQFTNLYEAWANSLHPDDRLLGETAIQQALAGEKDFNPEFRVLHPDGTIRFIKAYALVERNEQGEPQQMVGINYDITDRKQAEAALQQLTLDLQRSNQELEQFAYVASHDLQEPLRAITSYTQLFAKRYQGQIDEKANKYIHYVVDGAARMQQLIQDLLAYSRVGRYELKQQPTDCNVILQQVAKDLRMTIDETHAMLIVDSLPIILGDPMQVAQLFQNLISNALKYRGQASPIVRIGASAQGKDWLFSIQDNGIGIEPQYAERIFEIFQRLHTRREYEGTGLGLAICRKIVERHHGRIWMESQLGQGATFFFTLPALPMSSAING